MNKDYIVDKVEHVFDEANDRWMYIEYNKIHISYRESFRKYSILYKQVYVVISRRDRSKRRKSTIILQT